MNIEAEEGTDSIVSLSLSLDSSYDFRFSRTIVCRGRSTNPLRSYEYYIGNNKIVECVGARHTHYAAVQGKMPHRRAKVRRYSKIIRCKTAIRRL